MEYQKPEVLARVSAFGAIECTGDKNGGFTDADSGCDGTPTAHSNNAYEADE